MPNWMCLKRERNRLAEEFLRESIPFMHDSLRNIPFDSSADGRLSTLKTLMTIDTHIYGLVRIIREFLSLYPYGVRYPQPNVAIQ